MSIGRAAKAGLVSNARRGFWSFTQEGREKKLPQSETWDLYVRIRDANRPAGSQPDDIFWFAGAVWRGTEDQFPRFLEQGVWENEREDQFSGLVRRIRPGDQIAIEAIFVKKRVPFDVGGKSVSVMRIKATGTVLDNTGDGRTLRVAWDSPREPRDWYLYTYRIAIVEADKDAEDGRRLIEFAFDGTPQDYAWFLAQPYWREKYNIKPETISTNTLDASIVIDDEEITGKNSLTRLKTLFPKGVF